MKEPLHLRQISFSSHSWLDLIELGLTQTPVATEIHGLKKNLIRFQVDQTKNTLFLHHWMIADESQVHFRLQDLMVQPMPSLSADINTPDHLILKTVLVADLDTAAELQSRGIPAQVMTDKSWTQYFSIRKRQKIWGLVIDLPDHQLELEKTYRFVNEISWNQKKALHVRLESQCVDLILI